MAARGLLFPVLMAGFFVVFTAWTYSVPVQPAPDDPGTRFLRSGPGDEVTLEVTAYFGQETGDGAFYFTTQEERDDLPAPSGFTPEVQTAPVTLTIGASISADSPGFMKLLLDRRVGEVFTTPRLPPEESFGDWQGIRVINATLQEFPINVTLTPADRLGGQTFNLSQYEAFWQERGVASLDPGTRFACEGEARWDCVVVSIDRTAGVLSYRRDVSDSPTYDFEALLGNLEIGGEFTGHVEAVPVADGETMRLVLRPTVGDVFQIPQPITRDLQGGTYHVLSADADHWEAEYSSITGLAPQLVGAWTWFDFEVVAIEKPAADPEG